MSRPRAGTPSLLEHFAALSDPREGWRVLYPLREILLVVLCATLCGMDDVVEVKLWGEARLEVLRRFLPFERGIPSHDTLRRGDPLSAAPNAPPAILKNIALRVRRGAEADQ